MDSREKIDIRLSKLQSAIEHQLGRNPDDDETLNLLWEVQTLRAENLYFGGQNHESQQHSFRH